MQRNVPDLLRNVLYVPRWVVKGVCSIELRHSLQVFDHMQQVAQRDGYQC